MSSHIEYAFRPELASLKPYHVASSENMIKLDAMENPFPLPTHIQEQLSQAIQNTAIHRYPDASLSKIKDGIRQLMNPPKESDIVIGNGSDEILHMLIMAVARPDAVVMSIEPSFAMYKLLAQMSGVSYVGVSLNPDFSLNLAHTLEAIETHQPNLFFLAYPNNPTGNCFKREEIERIIQNVKGLVVIDEAYYAFTEHSFLSDVLNYPNVVIVRTVSKLGMAGLRLGCAIGSPEWMTLLERLRLIYNINSLTQKTFELLVEHKAVFHEQTQWLQEERERLYQQLLHIAGITHVWPSQCNFLLFKVANAPTIQAKLREQGVLIKSLHGTHPLLEDVLRVSIGTSAENHVFLAQLNAILSMTQ